jgi:hypothetical protein
VTRFWDVVNVAAEDRPVLLAVLVVVDEISPMRRAHPAADRDEPFLEIVR